MRSGPTSPTGSTNSVLLRVFTVVATLGLGLYSTACDEPLQNPPVGGDAGPADATTVAPDAQLPSECAEEPATLGEACESDADCADGCFCNGEEVCAGGVCRAGSAACAEDSVECTSVVCDEAERACRVVPVDSRCDDGDGCNGVETCSLTEGCISGEPLDCDDGDSCTVDSCHPTLGCLRAPLDVDGDGAAAAICGGPDCDDENPDIHPGMPELCVNGIDDNCDGVIDFADVSCQVTPENDLCEDAAELPLGTTITATTRRAAGNITTPCHATGTVPDVFYRIILVEPADLTITATAVSPVNAQITLGVWQGTECDGLAERCATYNAEAQLVLRDAAPGTYTLAVKTQNAVFDLRAETSPPTAALDLEGCDSDNETITASGSYIVPRSEMPIGPGEASCHPAGPAVIYRLVLDEPSDVRVETPNGRLWLTHGCTSRESIECLSHAVLERRPLPAGTYYLGVAPDGPAQADVAFDVDIAPHSPVALAGDGCESAVTLTPGVPATIERSSGTFIYDAGMSCLDPSATDVDMVYRFVLSEPSDVSVRVTTSPASPLRVALTRSCGSWGGEERCRTSGGLIMMRAVPAGDWYVVVTPPATAPSITATLEITPASEVPAVDRCETAPELEPGAIVEVPGSWLEDDFVLGCTTATGPEGVHRVEVTERSRLVAFVSPVDQPGTLHLALRAECDALPNLACGSSSTTMPGAIDRVVDPGTYFLVVETPATFTTGRYRLQAHLLPMPE